MAPCLAKRHIDKRDGRLPAWYDEGAMRPLNSGDARGKLKRCWRSIKTIGVTVLYMLPIVTYLFLTIKTTVEPR